MYSSCLSIPSPPHPNHETVALTRSRLVPSTSRLLSQIPDRKLSCHPTKMTQGRLGLPAITVLQPCTGFPLTWYGNIRGILPAIAHRAEKCSGKMAKLKLAHGLHDNIAFVAPRHPISHMCSCLVSQSCSSHNFLCICVISCD